ncbi:unnamed protein product [Paramecium sonneborni]|uniref:Uncharacterized protein n=1 Tax=Paramecium sonneborni TaxID=65129 RepID=A0A8S1Q3I6_9CILI|nr:unnamed protein product [Paramecium sonneborni]
MNTIEKENHFRSQNDNEFQKQMNLKYIYPRYKPVQQTQQINQQRPINLNKSSLSQSTQQINQSPKKIQIEQQQPPQQQQQNQQQATAVPQRRIRIIEIKDMN